MLLLVLRRLAGPLEDRRRFRSDGSRRRASWGSRMLLQIRRRHWRQPLRLGRLRRGREGLPVLLHASSRRRRRRRRGHVGMRTLGTRRRRSSGGSRGWASRAGCSRAGDVGGRDVCHGGDVDDGRKESWAPQFVLLSIARVRVGACWAEQLDGVGCWI